MQLGEIAKASPGNRDRKLSVLRSAPRPQYEFVLRARDAQKLALAKRAVEDMLEESGKHNQ